MTYKDVEAIRADIGLKRAEFAKVLGISISQYYSWSRGGKNTPKGSTLVLLNVFRTAPLTMMGLIKKASE